MMEHSLDEMITKRKKELADILERVGEVMLREELYCDNSLTLDRLAAKLGVYRNRLSEALNSDTEEG